MNDVGQAAKRDSENRVYFDRWSQNYDEGRVSPWFQYTQELAIQNLDVRPNSRVLDVGCGTGYAVIRLASLLSEGRACGIDISEGMIEAARSKVPKILRDRIEFRQASSAEIPYPTGEFDSIICTNSFHHYPNPVSVLTEMKRVLAPGGRLVIFENAPDLSFYTWMWDRFLRLTERGHVRYYHSGELGEMIRRAEFCDVQLCILQNEFLKYGKLFASIQIWRGCKPMKAGAHPL